MYPLTRWSYQDLCARLTVLESNQLFSELVVVSNQLVEQIVKRHLMREMNRQRRYWDPKQKQWIELHTPGERDNAMRLAGEPTAWKPMWRKSLYEECGLPAIEQAFIQIAGPCAWTTLTSNRPIPLLSAQTMGSKPLSYGFRQCRHRLVHGTASPAAYEIEHLAAWGADLVRNMLHPATGWPALLGWNAQERMPAFKKS